MRLAFGAFSFGIFAAFVMACATEVPETPDVTSTSALNEPVDFHHVGHPPSGTDGGATVLDASGDAALPVSLPSSVGPNDALAQSACALQTSAANHLILASRPEEAATVILVPSSTRRYHLHKPVSGAVAYAKLQTADWHMTVSFGAPAGVSVNVASGQPTLATSRNGACGDTLTDTRFIIHEWGSYLLTFGPDGPDELYFTVLAQTGS